MTPANTKTNRAMAGEWIRYQFDSDHLDKSETRAPFIENEKTGFLMNRIPPDREFVNNDDNLAFLQTFIDAIDEARMLDRVKTQSTAQRPFEADVATEQLSKRSS